MLFGKEGHLQEIIDPTDGSDCRRVTVFYVNSVGGVDGEGWQVIGFSSDDVGCTDAPAFDDIIANSMQI